MDILERMKDVICEYSNAKREELTLETNMRTDLDLNSLELVNMAVAIEDEFDVEIPDREALGLETIGDAVELIKKHLDD